MKPSILKRFRPSPALVVATIALAVAIGGTAYATIPDPSGVIHGCYAKVGGALRVIDSGAGKTCPASTLPLTWSQTGPHGAPGGLTGTDVVKAVTTIPSESVDNSWVYALSCPSGDAVLSGGYGTASVRSGIFIASSEAVDAATGMPEPTNDDTWQWVIDNTSGSSQGFTFEVICAPVSSSSTS